MKVEQYKVKNNMCMDSMHDSYATNIKIEKANVSKKAMTYLYSTGDSYVFMDMETYDQVELTSKQIENEAKFLKENLEVELSYFNDELIGLTLPAKISYVVTNTMDAVKGNTTNNAQKDAELENGMTVKVPLFINNGDEIVVSTDDGKYVSRK